MRGWFLFILLVLSLPVFALNTPETKTLVSDELSCELLAKDYIFAETGGTVPVRMDLVIPALRDPAFLTHLQDEYEKTLPDGKRPEFSIQQSASNTWFYINQKRERTDITEVAERLNGTDTFDLAYYTQGRRFFGSYQALIHIRLTGTGNSTDYAVAVYAYPENGFSRFFARHLPLVERYFQSKTDEISGVAAQISTRLCSRESLSGDQRLVGQIF